MQMWGALASPCVTDTHLYWIGSFFEPLLHARPCDSSRDAAGSGQVETLVVSFLLWVWKPWQSCTVGGNKGTWARQECVVLSHWTHSLCGPPVCSGMAFAVGLLRAGVAEGHAGTTGCMWGTPHWTVHAARSVWSSSGGLGGQSVVVCGFKMHGLVGPWVSPG